MWIARDLGYRGGRRTGVPLADEVMSMLKEWQKQCPKSDLDLVFPNWQGNPEKLQNIYRRCWYTLQQETGLVDQEGEAKYPLKELRHIRASLEIEKQANPKEIQELLGPSSIKITEFLGQLVHEGLQGKVIAKLPAA